MMDALDWHDQSCRRPDLIQFDGATTCLGCGGITTQLAPEGVESLRLTETSMEGLPVPFKYPKLPPDDPRALRLLTIYPGEIEDDIKVTLSITSLREWPRCPYEAVSYTWASEDGDATLSRPITLNSTNFLVTKNCEMALRRIRNRFSSRVVWVDAVCIDQQNIPERGQQVRLMPQIYASATAVLVYLGEAAPGIFELFSYLRDSTQPPSITARSRHASTLNSLLFRRYFSRVWVLQEIALAKRAIGICGPYSIPWHYFHPNICEQEKDMNGLIQVRPLLLEFDRPRYQDTTMFLALLDKTRSCQATDARDKIYGLYGIIAGSQAELPPVDYGISVGELYKQVAYFLGEKFGWHAVLTRSFWSPSKQLALPPWAPDWSTPLSEENNFIRARINGNLDLIKGIRTWSRIRHDIGSGRHLSPHLVTGYFLPLQSFMPDSKCSFSPKEPVLSVLVSMSEQQVPLYHMALFISARQDPNRRPNHMANMHYTFRPNHEMQNRDGDGNDKEHAPIKYPQLDRTVIDQAVIDFLLPCGGYDKDETLVSLFRAIWTLSTASVTILTHQDRMWQDVLHTYPNIRSVGEFLFSVRSEAPVAAGDEEQQYSREYHIAPGYDYGCENTGDIEDEERHEDFKGLTLRRRTLRLVQPAELPPESNNIEDSDEESELSEPWAWEVEELELSELSRAELEFCLA